MGSIVTTEYGTWIPNTISNNSVKIKALEDRLIVTWGYIPVTNFYGAVEFHYTLKKTVNDQEIIMETGVTSEKQFTYYFKRNTQNDNEFPEEDDIRDYILVLYAQNTEHNSLDENKSAEYSGTITYDFSEYGTWQIPDINLDCITKENIDRTTMFKMNIPSTSSGIKIFGNIKWKISIKRVRIVPPPEKSASDYPQDIEDAYWLKPDLFSSPYDDDDKYGVPITDPQTYVDYIIVDNNSYSQTLPLYGQKKTQHESDVPPYTGGSLDTEYRFRFKAFNEVSESNWLGIDSDEHDHIFTTARCTSLSDIVKANADYKNLYVERLSAINANIGLIQQGGFGDFENSDNFWALSDISAEESGISGGIKKGSFSVGDTREYVKVEPYEEIVNGQTVRRYRVRIKSGFFELESTTSSFTGQTVVYDDTDNTKRAILSAFGVTIESLDSVTNTWKRVGIFRSENTGLGKTVTLIGSGTENFKFGNFILNGEKLYSFSSDELDQNGENSAGIVTDGNIEALSTPVGETCFNGSATVPTQQSLKNVMFRNKGAVVIPNSDKVYVDGVLYDGKAKTANDNASTDWGLTQAQVQSRLFHSVIGD